MEDLYAFEDQAFDVFTFNTQPREANTKKNVKRK